MVRSYFPQQNRQSVLISTDTPPQGQARIGGFLLDLFQNARIAYSLRQLRTSYAGPAIRVRRTSDGTDQDIGFLADGNLDLPALTSFVGASDGQVKIWYDQSGNGIDLDNQPDNARLPLIIVAGVLQKSNNIVAMVFDGVGDTMVSSLSLPTPASHLFIFSVERKVDAADSGVMFNLNSPEGTTRVSFRVLFTGQSFWDAGSTGVDRLTSPLGFNDEFHHIIALSKTAGTNNQKMLFDSVEVTSRTQGSTSTVLGEITLSALNPTPSVGESGNFEIQELIFYDNNELANFTAISNAIMSYWKSVTFLTEDSLNILTTETDIELVTEA